MKNIKSILFLSVISVTLFLSSCTKEDEGVPTETPIDTPIDVDSPNILLIIADDMGKDAINGYAEGSIKPNTPHIDAIRNDGMSFNNLWVYPTCSPTRASMITGKYGYRTGVKWASDELAQSELTLQKYISDETDNRYSSAVIGKWHLSGNDSSVNPESFGIDYFAGLIRGAVNNYYQWQFAENGTSNQETEYITEVFTDLSIDWISEQSKPWFLWLAYTAPHTPFHAPPSEMHSQGNLPEYVEGLDPIPYYMAAIETMDYQIGRLLESIPSEERENTVIIFMGDNGTPNDAAQFPYSSNTVKGSIYQGGVNVPMFISGKGVTRTGADDNLICSTDLFSTIADLAGVANTEIHDSKSFKKLLSGEAEHRDFQYTEMDNGVNDLWAINNGQFKLIVNANGNQEMYNLATDAYESNNLFDQSLTSEAESAKAMLEAELLEIRN